MIKPISIAIGVKGNLKHLEPVMYALCDDGTIWMADGMIGWICLPHIPTSHAEFHNAHLDHVTSLFSDHTGNHFKCNKDGSLGEYEEGEEGQ